LHAREGRGVYAPFHIKRIAFTPSASPKLEDVALPERSNLVENMGSGKSSVANAFARWKESEVGGTSRAVFSAFCDSLRSGVDPLSAAPPQIVGLQRELGGKTFGIVWQRSRYYYGLEVDDLPGLNDVQWFNDKFEICDPHTLARRKTAQPQSRPKTLR
jgi:hypothetical protein